MIIRIFIYTTVFSKLSSQLSRKKKILANEIPTTFGVKLCSCALKQKQKKNPCII